MSEKVALPIEENVDKLALVIEFKMQQMKYTTYQAAIFNIVTYCLLGVSTKIYVIDGKVNKIYFSL
ncbi:hypothetical protein OXV74_19375 [Bacteroides thetaiotaomicron]|nr:hypothetical protein [Bacteroides thetaiotaomicron]